MDEGEKAEKNCTVHNTIGIPAFPPMYVATYSVTAYVLGGLPSKMLGFWVGAHGRKPRETSTTQAQKRTRPRKKDKKQGTDRSLGATGAHAGRSKVFETCFFSAVLGPAPSRETPAVSSLDTDPGVATLALPTACWRAPTPVNKWSRCAGPSAAQDRL